MTSDDRSPETFPGLEAELAMMGEISAQLTEAVCAAVPSWVVRSVGQRITAVEGISESELDAAAAQAHASGQTAADAARTALTELAAQPLDQQRSTPLAVVRGLVNYPNEVLSSFGVAPVRRDDFDVRANPEDVYAIAIGSWRDLSDEVHELGMAWGAAKAFLHKAMRQDG